jgi:hypothetical protein
MVAVSTFPFYLLATIDCHRHLPSKPHLPSKEQIVFRIHRYIDCHRHLPSKPHLPSKEQIVFRIHRYVVGLLVTAVLLLAACQPAQVMEQLAANAAPTATPVLAEVEPENDAQTESSAESADVAATAIAAETKAIKIYVDGALVAGFDVADLSELEKVTFIAKFHRNMEF